MTNVDFCFLIQRLKSKDLNALKIIYEECFQKIKYTAMCIVKNESDAYDIAMDVILKLVDYPSDPFLIKNHNGLLITMTKNEALNFIKKQSRSVNLDFDAMEFAANTEDGGLLWLKDIVDILTEEERDIFVDHCIWGKNLKVIAKETSISYRTVVRTYAAIKDKIKKLYS